MSSFLPIPNFPSKSYLNWLMYSLLKNLFKWIIRSHNIIYSNVWVFKPFYPFYLMLIFTITLYVGILIPILQGLETEAKEFSKLFECFQIISGRVKTFPIITAATSDCLVIIPLGQQWQRTDNGGRTHAHAKGDCLWFCLAGGEIFLKWGFSEPLRGEFPLYSISPWHVNPRS